MCDNCIEQNPKFYNGGTVHVETQTHTGHTIALEFVVREPICDTCLFKTIKELVHNVSQEPQKVETELSDKEKQLADARAEIEALKRVNVALNEEIKIQRAYVTGRDNTIERKDKLIEQMREALELAFSEARSTHCEQTILAALAAERGE